MNSTHGTSASAAERLLLTRLRLQQALGWPDADLQANTAAGTQMGTHGAAASPAARLSTASSATSSAAGSATPATVRPGARLLLATFRAWWARHPLHSAGTLALQAADAAARPIAQKHPVTLLLAAMACGAALAWARPWRRVNPRLVVAALVPGLLPILVPKLLQNLLPLLSRNAGQPLWPHLLQALLTANKPAGKRADQPAATQTSQRASKKV